MRIALVNALPPSGTLRIHSATLRSAQGQDAYGKYRSFLDDRGCDLIHSGRIGVLGRQVWYPLWPLARGHPHRRKKHHFLFPAGEFNTDLDCFDDNH